MLTKLTFPSLQSRINPKTSGLRPSSGDTARHRTRRSTISDSATGEGRLPRRVIERNHFAWRTSGGLGRDAAWGRRETCPQRLLLDVFRLIVMRVLDVQRQVLRHHFSLADVTLNNRLRIHWNATTLSGRTSLSDEGGRDEKGELVVLG